VRARAGPPPRRERARKTNDDSGSRSVLRWCELRARVLLLLLLLLPLPAIVPTGALAGGASPAEPARTRSTSDSLGESDDTTSLAEPARSFSPSIQDEIRLLTIRIAALADSMAHLDSKEERQQVLFQLAKTQLRLGVVGDDLPSRQDAVKALRRLTLDYPDRADYWLALSEAYLASTFASEGRRALDEALRRDPDNVQAHLLQAKAGIEEMRASWELPAIVDELQSVNAMLDSLDASPKGRPARPSPGGSSRPTSQAIRARSLLLAANPSSASGVVPSIFRMWTRTTTACGFERRRARASSGWRSRAMMAAIRGFPTWAS
jgi:tetratricopeptide (TPR) repeat protein